MDLKLLAETVTIVLAPGAGGVIVKGDVQGDVHAGGARRRTADE